MWDTMISTADFVFTLSRPNFEKFYEFYYDRPEKISSWQLKIFSDPGWPDEKITLKYFSLERSKLV